MQELVTLITNNGIGVICVAYLIAFQSTTMKNMLTTLEGINKSLAIIEDKIEPKRKEM